MKEEGSGGGHAILCVVVTLYMIMLAAVGYFAYKRKQAAASADAVAAQFGGSFGPAVLFLTFFSTQFSGFTVVGIPEDAARKGFLSLRWIGYLDCIVLGVLVLWPRLRRLAVERQYQSPNDFISDRFRSRSLRTASAVVLCLPMAIYLSAQLVSFASILSGMTLDVFKKHHGLCIIGVIILVMEKLGGMNSVVLTDAIQASIMICVFLLIPVALMKTYGTPMQFSPDDCETLRQVKNATLDGLSKHVPPNVCPTELRSSSQCIVGGCAQAVKPEWFLYPSHADQFSIFFFWANGFGFCTVPHMVHRAYIAETDNHLRLVTGFMLFAPFLAQTPNILVGLVKATFEPLWPAYDQESGAFAAITNRMINEGFGVNYFLATLMTCAVLAAIMSTADSVMMGISNTIAIDIYKGWLAPDAPAESIVRFGEFVSVGCVLLTMIFALAMSPEQFGYLLNLQNGLSLQVLPAYLLGLYSDITSRPLVCGIFAAALAAVALLFIKNPFAPYVPDVDIALLVNFIVVAVVQTLYPSDDDNEDADSSTMRTRFGEKMTHARLLDLMKTTREPNRIVLMCAFLAAVLAIPWYRSPGAPEGIIMGMPTWGFIHCLFTVITAVLGLAAVLSWCPPPEKVHEEMSDTLGDMRPTADPNCGRNNVFTPSGSFTTQSAPGRRSVLQTLRDEQKFARPLVAETELSSVS